MHLFYTLITSGLLILTEIPVEQPPSIVVYQDVSYALSHSASDSGGSQESVTYSSTYSSFDQSGEWYLTSSPITYLGIPNDSFAIQAKQEDFEAQQPPQYEGVRLQDDPELIPAETKVLPTPIPNTTAPTPIAVAHSTEANSTTAKNALATYRQQSSLPVSGLAMFYNPNVMQEVLSNRLAMGQVSLCGECVGTVALLRAGDLNRRVWLQWADGTVEGPFLVADVAATQHVEMLLARNWVVDVDNSTAVRRKMAGPVWVTVWGAPPMSGELELPPFAPLYSSLPNAIPTVAQGAFPVETVSPTITPLPALGATPAASAAVMASFPTETPVPTVTPLPALNATPIVGAGQDGFPTDTPAPTNTPLPVMPMTTIMPTQTPFPAASPTLSLTLSPTMTPTPTLQASTTVNAVVTQPAFPPDTPVPTVTPLPAINPLPTPTVTP